MQEDVLTHCCGCVVDAGGCVDEAETGDTSQGAVRHGLRGRSAKHSVRTPHTVPTRHRAAGPV